MFFTGEPLNDLYLIVRYPVYKVKYDHFMMTFRDKALILNEQENWKLFSQTEEIAQEIKTGLNELREEIKANFEAKKKKEKVEEDVCDICYEPDNLTVLSCGHKVHAEECLE